MLTTYEYSEFWICLNCRNIGPLSEHGRCTTCDSDSVAVADTGWSLPRQEVEALERLFHAREEVPASVEDVYQHTATRPVFSGHRGRAAGVHRRTSRYR